MASIRQQQEPPRPFFCHHCSHQWLKSSNSLFECPRCREGFIEEVSEDFNPNLPPFPTPQMSLGNILYQAFSDRNEDTRSRNNRSTTRNRAENNRRNSPSRSRSPHMATVASILGHANREQNRNDVQIVYQSRTNPASRFLSVAIDDIMSLIFTSERQHGMTQEQLDAIPLATITSEQVEAQSQCAVCFEEFQLNENEIRKLLCNHFFHEKCIFPWLRNNATCPVCRSSLASHSDSEDETAPVIRVARQRARLNQNRGTNTEERPSTSNYGRLVQPIASTNRFSPRRISNTLHAAIQRGFQGNQVQSDSQPSTSRQERISRQPILNSPISSRTRSRSAVSNDREYEGGFRIRTRQRNTASHDSNVHPYQRNSLSRQMDSRNTPISGRLRRRRNAIDLMQPSSERIDQPAEPRGVEQTLYDLLVNRVTYRQRIFESDSESDSIPSIIRSSPTFDFDDEISDN